MLIYLAGLQDIPREQYEAATIEGAGFFRRVQLITMPQMMGLVGIMFILDVINKLNEIGAPMIMTNGGPAGATETMILYAYKQATNNLDYSYAITMANIVFVIVFIMTALQMKLQSRKEKV